ncbi:MAG: M28 family peptidase [Nitrospiria bacterium]
MYFKSLSSKALFLFFILMMFGLGAFHWDSLIRNKAETCPDHTDPSLKTRTYALPRDRLFKALSHVIKARPRWKIIRHDLSEGIITAERQTRIFGFIDDIEIRISKTDEDAVTLNLKSASRVGKGDFGQNARNIREIFTGLDRQFAAARGRSPELFAGLSDRLATHVRTLALQIGERNFTQPLAYRQAAEYIAEVFEQSGYAPRFESFRIDSPPFLTELRTNPADKSALKTEYQNIVAIKKGRAKESIVVGAHYDSVIGTPGADDNASGVAVLLELARLLQDFNLEKTVIFAAFANEEPPFFRTPAMGSARFVKAHADEKITFMISLEMLGFYSDTPGAQSYPPFLKYFYPDKADFIAVVGNLGSRHFVTEMAEAMRAAVDMPVETLSAPRIVPGVDYSDQLNFWKAGIPAVMITDTAFNRNPHYHTRHDLPKTLNTEKMAEVTQGIFGALLQLGEVR